MTKIEWATETWNPITGCTPVSEGCENCYAKRMATRLRGRFGYPKDDPFRVTFHRDRLEQTLTWTKPRMVFVCSMGDLFHEDIPFEDIETIWQFMPDPRVFKTERGPHIWMLLTKRPRRALEFHKWLSKRWPASGSWGEIWHPNLWLGVTAENQKRADERIPTLLQIPAAVRFVSIEPMLGPVDLRRGFAKQYSRLSTSQDFMDQEGIDWVILGGETDTGARPMHPDWARSVRDKCVEAGVPFFFKQWGDGYRNADIHDRMRASGASWTVEALAKKGGRLLDGREWNQMPGD